MDMLNNSFARIDLIKKALDASWMKNEAISANIANVNTPGYKRKTVEFDSVLKDYLSESAGPRMTVTNPKHFPISGGTQSLNPEMSTVEDTSFRLDQNNVNIDVEMSEYSKNLIKYNALIQQVSGQIKNLRMAIRDGR